MGRGKRGRGASKTEGTVPPEVEVLEQGAAIEGDGSPGQGPLEPEGAAEAAGAPLAASVGDDIELRDVDDDDDLDEDDEDQEEDDERDRPPARRAAPPPPAHPVSSAPAGGEDDFVPCRVKHGEIHTVDGLKTTGETFRARRRDVGWMLDTGNIVLVER